MAAREARKERERERERGMSISEEMKCQSDLEAAVGGVLVALALLSLPLHLLGVREGESYASILP